MSNEVNYDEYIFFVKGDTEREDMRCKYKDYVKYLIYALFNLIYIFSYVKPGPKNFRSLLEDSEKGLKSKFLFG